MSKLCCVFCGVPFNPGKTNRKGFCSLECWRKFEKLNASHNCSGIARSNSSKNKVSHYVKVKVDGRVGRVKRMNLGKLLQEVQDEEGLQTPTTFSVAFNPNVSNATHQKLEALLQQIKSFKTVNGLF